MLHISRSVSLAWTHPRHFSIVCLYPKLLPKNWSPFISWNDLKETRGEVTSLNFPIQGVKSICNFMFCECLDCHKRSQNLPDHNPCPVGGCLNTPIRFFVNNLKTAARSAAVFGTPYHASFSHMLLKFQTQVTQGQVIRSRQVTSPHKKFECSSTPHRWNDCLETFRDCYKYGYL